MTDPSKHAMEVAREWLRHRRLDEQAHIACCFDDERDVAPAIATLIDRERAEAVEEERVGGWHAELLHAVLAVVQYNKWPDYITDGPLQELLGGLEELALKHKDAAAAIRAGGESDDV